MDLNRWLWDATVPGTVLTTMINQGVYPIPVGLNQPGDSGKFEQAGLLVSQRVHGAGGVKGHALADV